jgi:hypothetical protein
VSKRLTVFYSWQCDTPSKLNRNFIESALHEALKRLHSDAKLENALRDTKVELDKDTKGVAGSPPIAETILRKIEECAVFVADFTFVGVSKTELADSTETPRQFPNPNVLIEYGYALRCHSHTALIGVMNTAFGTPDAESLPFNIRHFRRPIAYHLADSSAADKNDQYERLVGTLVDAIGLILSHHSSTKIPVERFVPQQPTTNAAVFFERTSDLFGDRSGSFTVPNGAKAYLRLYPSVVVAPIDSQLEARNLANQGNLWPLGRVSGCGFDRNIFGAIAFEHPDDGKVFHFTQLFLSREIWGVDSRVLNADHIRMQQQLGLQDDSKRYIPNGYIGEYFVKALLNYMAFARMHLQLSPPLRIEAGLTGIKGYSLAIKVGHFIGKALQDTIIWQSEIVAYEKPAWEILSPFFDRIWDNCGHQRPVEFQTALAKGFGA